MPKAQPLGTVLVVGGCGFVGSNVVDQLLNFPSEDNLPTRSSSNQQSPDDVVIHSDHVFPSLRHRYPPYDPSTTTIHALDLRCTHNRYPGCTYHEADITSESQLSTIFSQIKPTVVINTASPTFDSPPSILHKVNTEGTQTLINVSRASGVKIFIHTSSSSVVHDAESDLLGATEEFPYVDPNPREPYSESKVHAERIVLEANSAGFLTCAVRPAGIIGELDRSGIGYSLTHQAATAPPWQMRIQLGDNSNLFDCTYVGNVAYGLLCAAQTLNAQLQRQKEGKAPPLDHERADGEAFNVTNGEPLPFWDIARFVWSRYSTATTIAPEQVWAVPKGWAVSIGWASETFSKVSGRKSRFTAQTAKYACMHRWFSRGRAEEVLGFKTGKDAEGEEVGVGVVEGLERTVRWFKAEVEGAKDGQVNGSGEKKVQ
jgi:sterol-4alpha-carboxylate 3-dehydrogenase (decarboxylating)